MSQNGGPSRWSGLQGVRDYWPCAAVPAIRQCESAGCESDLAKIRSTWSSAADGFPTGLHRVYPSPVASILHPLNVLPNLLLSISRRSDEIREQPKSWYGSRW